MVDSYNPCMAINQTLAHAGDSAFTGAVIVYCLAMFLLLIELSSSARTSVKPTVEGKVSTGESPGVLPPSTRPHWTIRCGKMGFNVAIVGVLLEFLSIVLRGCATHRVPWGNMFEFINLSCLAAATVAIIMLRTSKLRPLISIALIPIVILLFIAGTYLYATAAPVVPALKSYWLAIHVSIISISSGVFIMSGMCSVMIVLLRYSSHFPGRIREIIQRFPSIDTLDKVAYSTVKFAFPLFTVGVIFGAIWAESAWGRYWGWDPKETAAFVTWLSYACYLHARATAGWKKETVAIINILGFTAVIVNLFVINLVTSGLHSYAGVN